MTVIGALAGRSLAGALATAAATTSGCFVVGAVAARFPSAGLILVGALGCLVVYLTGPQRMAWAALFLSFASLPAALHAGKVIGPVSIYVYQVAVVLAIVFLIPIARLRFSHWALAGVFALAVAFFGVAGAAAGHGPERVVREATFLCEMVAGFLFATLIVRTDCLRESLRVSAVVLWLSAAMIVASSFTGLQLAGRAESLRVETGAAAIRLLTATEGPAMAVLAALVAAQILGRARFSLWLMIGMPALAITSLSFSRHVLIALAVAALVAFVAEIGWPAIRRSAALALVGATTVAALIGVALFLLQRWPAGEWLENQLNAFSDRVIGGLSMTAMAVDSSTLARVHENTNLWRAIGEAPLLGHGLGYAYQLPFGGPGTFTATLGTTYAHNFYLWWLVKAGAVGMAVFAVFALTPLVLAMLSASAAAKISAAVGAGLLAICVVNPLPLEPANALVLGIVLGAAMAFSRPASERPSAASAASAEVVNDAGRAPRAGSWPHRDLEAESPRLD